MIELNGRGNAMEREVDTASTLLVKGSHVQVLLVIGSNQISIFTLTPPLLSVPYFIHTQYLPSPSLYTMSSSSTYDQWLDLVFRLSTCSPSKEFAPTYVGCNINT